MSVSKAQTAARARQIGRKSALVIGVTGPRGEAWLGAMERRLLSVTAESRTHAAMCAGRHCCIEFAKF